MSSTPGCTCSTCTWYMYYLVHILSCCTNRELASRYTDHYQLPATVRVVLPLHVNIRTIHVNKGNDKSIWSTMI